VEGAAALRSPLLVVAAAVGLAVGVGAGAGAGGRRCCGWSVGTVDLAVCC